MTGGVIRSSKTTATRYERDRPGELVHVDVKKIGRIPAGGGWRAWGRDATRRDKKARVGYDYIHSAVDDHSRVAYSEIHDDEKGHTAAEFLARAAEFFASHGVEIEAAMTDNHLSYTNSHAVRDQLVSERLAVERLARSTTAPHRKVVHWSALLAMVDGTSPSGRRPSRFVLIKTRMPVGGTGSSRAELTGSGWVLRAGDAMPRSLRQWSLLLREETWERQEQRTEDSWSKRDSNPVARHSEAGTGVLLPQSIRGVGGFD